MAYAFESANYLFYFSVLFINLLLLVIAIKTVSNELIAKLIRDSVLSRTSSNLNFSTFIT